MYHLRIYMYLVSKKELIGDSTLKMEIQKSNNI